LPLLLYIFRKVFFVHCYSFPKGVYT
jgi:hypothetical protein